MPFPLLSEYIESIKSAEDNFNELSYLRPVLDDDGLPVMTSGNFAVVFKMQDERDGKLYAVKCFTREQEGREETYKLIEEELERVQSIYVVSIKYLECELFVDSKQTEETEFPVVLMDWVEGKTLDKFLRENINNQYVLGVLAFRFSQLAQWLIKQPFAHGDLKPDNILVREDGTLVLIDYDGMYVPGMGCVMARELGSPNFRHPKRSIFDFDKHIDDFPLVSILLSLKAISLNPQLLEEYGAADRLLFSEKDYMDIGNSKVVATILNCYPEKETQKLLSTMLIAVLTQKMERLKDSIIINRPIWRDPILNEIQSGIYTNNEETVFNSLIRLYAQGDKDVAWKIGWCYENGYGVKPNRDYAKEYYMQSAENGNPTAQRLLGFLCRSYNWLSAAGSQGDSDAFYELGWFYYDDWEWEWIGNWPNEPNNELECIKNSILMYTKSAEMGNSRAQYKLGYMFLFGDGVSINYENAMKWFLMSAMNGNDDAQYQLGICYEKGWGVERDYNKAFSWYMKSAICDNPRYQYHLARCYQTGKFGTANNRLAVFWYEEANSGEDNWRHYDSLWCLGYCYENGFGVERNHQKALEMFSASMDYYIKYSLDKSAFEDEFEEDSLIFWRMGYCYENGFGIKKDINKALLHYKKALISGTKLYYDKTTLNEGIQNATDALVRLRTINNNE